MHSLIILFFSNLFSTDMIVIVFFALLLFGGEKLPEIARGIGKGIRDFKDASEGVKREINNQINSFEEKREEKKLDEAAAAVQSAKDQMAADSQPVVANTIPVADYHHPVENTIPVAESHETGYSIPETENHVVESHVHTATNTIEEPIKNS